MLVKGKRVFWVLQAMNHTIQQLVGHIARCLTNGLFVTLQTVKFYASLCRNQGEEHNVYCCKNCAFRVPLFEEINLLLYVEKLLQLYIDRQQFIYSSVPWQENKGATAGCYNDHGSVMNRRDGRYWVENTDAFETTALSLS